MPAQWKRAAALRLTVHSVFLQLALANQTAQIEEIQYCGFLSSIFFVFLTEVRHYHTLSATLLIQKTEK